MLNNWGDDAIDVLAERKPGNAGRANAARRLRLTITLGTPCLIACFWVAVQAAPLVRQWQSARLAGNGVLVGEFEHQDALLLAWPSRNVSNDQRVVLVDIVRAVQGNTPVVILYESVGQRTSIQDYLQKSKAPSHNVRLVHAPLDRLWIRDFGPHVLKMRSGGRQLVDFDYEAIGVGDELKSFLVNQFEMPLVKAPLWLEGGNLLNNGCGLCLTTTKLIKQNRSSKRRVAGALADYFGATQTVFLKPLSGEPTEHVDMFATFTAPDTVVIGQYDDDSDPVNRAILDENARKLSGLETACGPLKVVRIPMPDRSSGVWATYTNVVYVNRTLLVPTYSWVDRALERRVLERYRELLPGWKVTGIPAEALIEKGGSLHCVTLNMCVAPGNPLSANSGSIVP